MGHLLDMPLIDYYYRPIWETYFQFLAPRHVNHYGALIYVTYFHFLASRYVKWGTSGLFPFLASRYVEWDTFCTIWGTFRLFSFSSVTVSQYLVSLYRNMGHFRTWLYLLFLVVGGVYGQGSSTIPSVAVSQYGTLFYHFCTWLYRPFLVVERSKWPWM